jgi:hypothetical protein
MLFVVRFIGVPIGCKGDDHGEHNVGVQRPVLAAAKDTPATMPDPEAPGDEPARNVAVTAPTATTALRFRGLLPEAVSGTDMDSSESVKRSEELDKTNLEKTKRIH